MKIKASLLIIAISVLLSSAPAFATTFTFSRDNLPGHPSLINDLAGKTKSITTTFNNNTNLLTLSLDYAPNADGINANGAWVMLSDGANPRNQTGKYAIFYLDETSKKVSIDEYDGAKKSGSWKSPGNFLGSTGLVVSESNGVKKFNFAMDMTKINSLSTLGSDWKGAAFNNKIGDWAHGVNASEVKLTDKGMLSAFKHGKASFYDVDNLETTAVPEPASAAAIGLFSAAAAFAKRKQSA